MKLSDRPHRRQPVCADQLGHEVVVGDVGVALADQLGRGHGLGEGIDALEAVASKDHRVADPPQEVERQRAVLAAAVVVDAGTRAGGELAIADRAAFGEDLAHLGDRRSVLALELDPVRLVELAAHEDAPVRQLVHRPDREPAAPVEELALLVGERRPVALSVVEHTGVEDQVVGAREEHERIELELLDGAHRLFRALESLPPATRPQALLPEDEPASDLERDLQRHPATRRVRASSRGRARPRRSVAVRGSPAVR